MKWKGEMGMEYKGNTNGAAIPPQTVSAGKSQNDQGNKKKILLVDDDEVTLKIMKAYLQQHYTVFTVSNGIEALQFLAKQAVDLILLDYMMPEIDGPTVFRHIRRDFPNLQTPIVFLTGVSEKELVIKGLDLHPKDYLLKPVARQDLLERVDKIINE